MCKTGLTPWMPQDKYLEPCFQELVLQLPALVLFAIISSYHCGHQTVFVRRNKVQLTLIYLRIIAAFLLAVLPIYDIYVIINQKIQIWPIDVLLNVAEIFTWMIHFGN